MRTIVVENSSLLDDSTKAQLRLKAREFALGYFVRQK